MAKMKLLKQKKADFTGKKMVHFTFILGIFFPILCLFLVFILHSYGSGMDKMPEGLETSVFIKRFLDSPDCFAYQDQITLRAYPRTIGWERFTNETLNDCYYTEKSMAFRLRLKNPLENERIIQTKNWEDFSGYSKKTVDVNLYYNNKIYKKKLMIESQNAK